MSIEWFTPLEKLDEEGLTKLNTVLLQLVSGQGLGDMRNLVYDVNFGVAGVETILTHNSGKTLSRYVIIRLSQPAVVYDGSTANDENNTYLRCSTSGTSATIMLF